MPLYFKGSKARMLMKLVEMSSCMMEGAEIGWNLLSWFLTKKMKSRVTVVSSGDDDIDTLLKVVGGFEYIPVDFGNYKGELISDMVAEYRR